jgi:hypothetical protein
VLGSVLEEATIRRGFPECALWLWLSLALSLTLSWGRRRLVPGRCMQRNALIWTVGDRGFGLLQWRWQGALLVLACWVRARQRALSQKQAQPAPIPLAYTRSKTTITKLPDITSTKSDLGSVQSGSFWHHLVLDRLQHQMCSRQARISPSSPSAAAHPPLSSANYFRARRDTFGLHIQR